MCGRQDEIMEEMKKVTDGVIDVIVYPNAADKTKNRGFAFVEYESHRAAAMARRKLLPGRIQLWNHQIAVDWAEPEQEVDDDIMNKVRYSSTVSLSHSAGVVSDISQCQIALICAIARARSRKVSCATVYLIFISLLTLCLGS